MTAKAVALAARAKHPTASTVQFTNEEPGSPLWHTDVALVRLQDHSTTTVDIGLIDAGFAAALNQTLPHAWAAANAPWSRTGRIVSLDIDAALEVVVISAHNPFDPVSLAVFTAVQSLTPRSIRSLTLSTEQYDNGWFFSTEVSVDYADGDGDVLYCDAIDDYGLALSELTTCEPCRWTEITISDDGRRVETRG
ncbi:hypothetical protein GS504_01300 [Rhodococcus hoagii]|nr:hypothetical protein [Prescottella equi]NKS71691.1 hypothetical protein [Prescottella equi]